MHNPCKISACKLAYFFSCQYLFSSLLVLFNLSARIYIYQLWDQRCKNAQVFNRLIVVISKGVHNQLMFGHVMHFRSTVNCILRQRLA